MGVGETFLTVGYVLYGVENMTEYTIIAVTTFRVMAALFVLLGLVGTAYLAGVHSSGGSLVTMADDEDIPPKPPSSTVNDNTGSQGVEQPFGTDEYGPSAGIDVNDTHVVVEDGEGVYKFKRVDHEEYDNQIRPTSDEWVPDPVVSALERRGWFINWNRTP